MAKEEELFIKKKKEKNITLPCCQKYLYFFTLYYICVLVCTCMVCEATRASFASGFAFQCFFCFLHMNEVTICLYACVMQMINRGACLHGAHLQWHLSCLSYTAISVINYFDHITYCISYYLLYLYGPIFSGIKLYLIRYIYIYIYMALWVCIW